MLPNLIEFNAAGPGLAFPTAGYLMRMLRTHAIGKEKRMKRISHLLMAMVLLAGGANAEWMFRDVPEYLTATPPNASTVAWGDVDNDGDPDLFVGGGSDSSVLYVNEGRLLVDGSAAYGLTTLNTCDVYSAQFVDFDEDGYLDLFLLTDDSDGFRLLRQLSNHRFQWVQNNLNIEFFDRITSAGWVDVDGDGSLDLILSNGPTRGSSLIVVESEDLELVENRDSGFLPGSGAVGAIAVEDYDRDGDADIFVGGSGSEAARLLRKEGTSWVDWAPRFGIPRKMGVTGAVWLDYNNDQQLDLYSPGEIESNCLMRGTTSMGTHGLTPVTEPMRVPPPDAGARYAHAVDADMDGWTDLFIIKADVPGCALLKNEQGCTWTDVTRLAGLDPALPVTASAWADWDGDGDLDLALARGIYGLTLYRNDTEGPHEFIMVNPVSSVTHAPLRGCTMWMQFEAAKAVGSTHLHTAAPGGDGMGVLLVNSSNYKSGQGNLLVRWPNGLESRYPLSELRLGGMVTLIQPVAPPTVQMTTEDESPTPIHLTVSPNPFNPTTTLSYTLAEAADVELKVFNLMAQEVATLVSGPQAAGTYRVPFNGGSLPSGLYLTRLTAGGRSHMSRLLLAK